ncbi:MAG: GLPGLI family protein [Muribaculaceae bacterium]|nr:GLPGLI family protein [Muribaculaceae bacterium]
MKINFKYLLVLGAICSAFFASAQMRMSFMMESPSFMLLPENTDKFQTLDSSYLTLSYNVRFRASEKDDSLSRADLMDLQLGRLKNAFFSRNLRELDIQNTADLKNNMQINSVPENYLGWDIITNHSDSLMTVRNRLPYTTQVVEYSETIPVIDWKIQPEETDTIMGYECKTATGDFGGRTWKIYFSEQIPLPYGPWKLSGANGLILKAADTENNFIFEAVGLSRNPNDIIRYDWPRKSMEKKEWQELEKNIYKNAGAFVKSTGTRISIIDNSEKGFHRLNEDWSEFYNPLER